MIARVWSAQVDEARAQEYELFASRISLPMFRQQPGYLGALMLREGGHSIVVTLWRDQQTAASLAASAEYRRTVRQIRDRGFLLEESEVENLNVHASDLAFIREPHWPSSLAVSGSVRP